MIVILPFANFSSPITQDDIANEQEKIMKLSCEDLKWYIGTPVLVGNPGVAEAAQYNVFIPLTGITPDEDGIFSIKVQDTLSATCDDWVILTTTDNRSRSDRPYFEYTAI